jgi:hypothetical protein
MRRIEIFPAALRFEFICSDLIEINSELYLKEGEKLICTRNSAYLR